MIHKVKALHSKGVGPGIRVIARELGISRNTVRKYLRMDEVAIGKQQSHRARHKQLDDYRNRIATLLGQFPNLSTVKVVRKPKERHPELGASDRSVRRHMVNSQFCCKFLSAGLALLLFQQSMPTTLSSSWPAGRLAFHHSWKSSMSR